MRHRIFVIRGSSSAPIHFPLDEWKTITAHGSNQGILREVGMIARFHAPFGDFQASLQQQLLPIIEIFPAIL
jgi:hypothetical protein